MRVFLCLRVRVRVRLGLGLKLALGLGLGLRLGLRLRLELRLDCLVLESVFFGVGPVGGPWFDYDGWRMGIRMVMVVFEAEIDAVADDFYV